MQLLTKNVFLIFVRRNTVFSIPAAIVQCCQKTGDWWLKRDAKSDLIITIYHLYAKLQFQVWHKHDADDTVHRKQVSTTWKKHTVIYLPNLPLGASLRFRIDWGHRVIMRNGKVCIWYSSNREPLKYWYFPWSISLINCDKNIEKISEGLPRDYA